MGVRREGGEGRTGTEEPGGQREPQAREATAVHRRGHGVSRKAGFIALRPNSFEFTNSSPPNM